MFVCVMMVDSGCLCEVVCVHEGGARKGRGKGERTARRYTWRCAASSVLCHVIMSECSEERQHSPGLNDYAKDPIVLSLGLGRSSLGLGRASLILLLGLRSHGLSGRSLALGWHPTQPI